jgi:hypothetical protein
MRGIIITPIVLLLTAALGISVCRALDWNVSTNDAVYAAIAALLASFAGMAPLLLARRADQNAAAQAGLVATMVHMFVAAGLSGAAIIIAHRGTGFTYWMFAFYGVTLIVVATEAVRLVRHARPAIATKQ